MESSNATAKNISLNELEELIGKDKAQKISSYFKAMNF